MPSLKLSETVRVEVIRDTVNDGLFNHADVKFRFDQAWFYLLDFETDEHKSAIKAIHDYLKDFAKAAQALRQNDFTLSQASFDQFFAFALCVKKMADKFDEIDPEYEHEEEHTAVTSARTVAEMAMRRLQNTPIEGERNLFNQYGVPKMFFYPVLESQEQKDAYAEDAAQVNDLQLIQIYVHLSARFGPPGLIFTMLAAARSWLYAMAEQQRRTGMLLQLLERLGQAGEGEGEGEGAPN